jgi:hypothetical protein
MRPFALCLFAGCALLLAACEEPTPTTYPVSGEPCSPEDRVQGLDAHHCEAPV